MHLLTERQIYIFKKIVEYYISDNDPVGSKTLQEKAKLDYSSATIRNDMSVLENAGLIEKTHSSSGRIPSEEGYRLYVDQLIVQNDHDIESVTFDILEKSLNHTFYRMEDIVDATARVLSHLTSYTAIVLGPEAKTQNISGFRFVPIKNNQVLCLLVTDTGIVKNITFELPRHITLKSLERVSSLIEKRVVGLSIEEANKRLQEIMPELAMQFSGKSGIFFRQLQEVFQVTETKNHAYISGKTNLLDFLEDPDVSRIKSLLDTIDNHANWVKLYNDLDNEIDVKIGGELNNELLEDFSLITASYKVVDYGEGVIAVLGPRNMSYEKTIHLLSSFQELLPEAMRKFYNEID